MAKKNGGVPAPPVDDDVELTQAEIDEAVDKAAADKKSRVSATKADAEAKAKADAEAQHRRENPRAHAGLYLGTSYTYVEFANDPPQRTIVYDRKNWEHVDTDADGVWLYRSM